jgi:uncharacterized damage-inducible protein DinB
MYTTVDAFLDDWKGESATTLRILRALTDASLGQKVSPEGRTLGFIAWHLALTIGEMGGKAGLMVAAPPEDLPAPGRAAEIVTVYEAAARALAGQVRKLWTDRMLQDELSLYGRMWRRGSVLDSIVNHQIHHRGQMTVLMRQAGLPVPGVYGPSREEWASMGMAPMP